MTLFSILTYIRWIPRAKPALILTALFAVFSQAESWGLEEVRNAVSDDADSPAPSKLILKKEDALREINGHAKANEQKPAKRLERLKRSNRLSEPSEHVKSERVSEENLARPQKQTQEN
jgi:hypothetical protein